MDERGTSKTRSGGRGARPIGLALLLAALLLPTCAQAARHYEGSFGPDGSEASSFAGSLGSRPVAVDSQSGNIYVANNEDEAIFKFDQNHQPSNFSALGSNKITAVPTRTAVGRSQLAVDSASHRIYFTSGASLNSIFAFEASGAPASFSALGGAHEITGFTALCGVAVDSNGDVYAADRIAEKVTVFAPSGAKLTEFAVAELPGKAESGPCNLAVDSAGDVYVNHSRFSVEKFTPSAFPVTALTTYASAGTADPGNDYSLAINPATGHLYVLSAVEGTDFGSTSSLMEVVEYDASGTKLRKFGDSGPGTLHYSAGIAVKGSGAAERIYASDVVGQKRVEVFGLVVPDATTLAATGVAAHTALLHGELGASNGPPATCHFQFTTEAAYLADKATPGHDGFAGAQNAPCSPAGPFSGAALNPVGAEATGLLAGTTYRFRLLGEDENGQNPGEALSFETLGKPQVGEAQATEVTTDSALIVGQVNANGSPTDFAVQYVSAAEYAESGFAHATTSPSQPIGEAIELVEVSQPLGGLEPATAYRFRLIASNEVGETKGEARSFATFALPAPGLPDSRAYELVSPPAKAGEVFPPETNGGLGGSCRECLPGALVKMPMQSSPDGSSIAYEGQAFGAGIASGANEYLAARGAEGWATDPLSHPEYNAAAAFQEQQDGFLAFSDDLSRAVIFQVEPSLAPEAPPEYSNLYLWRRGAEGLTPAITAPPPHRLAGSEGDVGANRFLIVFAGVNAGEGPTSPFTHIAFEANDSLTKAAPGTAPAAPEVGAAEHDLYQWSPGGGLELVNVLPGNLAAAPNAVIGSGRLLSPDPLREGPDFDHAISNDGSRIFWSKKATGQLYLRIDGKETREIPDPGKFLTAAADGSKVLLGDGHLYDAEPAVPTQIADLTAGQGGFQGILGASDGLSRVYFVDTAVLSGESAEHRSPVPGKDNLYLWEEGTASFIATLLPKDNFFGNEERLGDWRPSPSYRTAQVSGDGRYATFMSIASELIPGYDNEQRESKGCFIGHGSPACAEVYEYDAATAKLACPSCNPSGQRPLGYSNLTLIGVGGGLGTFLPQPRNLTANGRLFFESQDALSLDDQNGHVQDVYEWEPEGVGGCESAREEGGCLSLISTGQSPDDSFFLNATPSGNDAFLVTRQELVPADRDDLLDLYDARVGGGIAEAQTPPCLGEACKGPSSAPPAEVPGAGSASFAGPPNPKASPPRHKHKKHARKKRHAKKRAHAKRGAQR